MSKWTMESSLIKLPETAKCLKCGKVTAGGFVVPYPVGGIICVNCFNQNPIDFDLPKEIILIQKLRQTVEWLDRYIKMLYDNTPLPYTANLAEQLEELRDDLAETLKKLED